MSARASTNGHVDGASPYLSIILTGRNDNFGGDFNDRFFRALRFNQRNLTDAGVDHELILVEWAPIDGKPYLAELVREAIHEIPPERFTVYIVDPRYHDAYSQNPRLKFLEFIAKNVGIARSRGRFILTTNTDVYLGREVMETLAAQSLDPGILYRSTRIDIRLGADLTHVDWPLLEDQRNWVAINTIRPPLFTDASGDFLLMDAASYRKVRGFNEVYRVAKIHLDGNFCAKVFGNGYPIVDIGAPIYHLNHVGSFTVTRGIYADRPHEAPWGHNRWKWGVIYENPEDWALQRAPALQIDDNTTWLDFTWDAVPSLVDLKRLQLPAARGQDDPDESFL
jgi:hypothetical protein